MNKISGNLVFSLGIKFAAIFVGLFLSRWLNRLPVADFAEFNLIFRYLNIIIPSITLGLPLLIQKYFTLNQNNNPDELAKFWTTMAVVRGCTFFFGIIIILLTYNWANIGNLVNIVGIFCLQFILITDLAYRAICDSYGHSWQYSLTDFIGKLLQLSLLYLGTSIFSQSPNLNYYVLVSLIAYIFTLLLDVIIQRKYTKFSSFDFETLKKYSKPMLYLGLSATTVGIYINSDLLFLQFLGASKQIINGYSNAYKLYEVASVVPGLLTPIFASIVIKKFNDRSPTKFIHLIKKRLGLTKSNYDIISEWIVITFGIGILTTLGFLIFAPLVLNLIDPANQYTEISIRVLPFLGASLVIVMVLQLLANLNVFLGSEKYELISTLATMIFTLTIYWVLISNYGFIGAGIATLASFSFDLVLKIIFFLRIKRISTL